MRSSGRGFGRLATDRFSLTPEALARTPRSIADTHDTSISRTVKVFLACFGVRDGFLGLVVPYRFVENLAGQFG